MLEHPSSHSRQLNTEPTFIRYLDPDGVEMVGLWREWSKHQLCVGCNETNWEIRHDSVAFCLTCTADGRTRRTTSRGDLEVTAGRILKLVDRRPLPEAVIRRRAGNTRLVSEALRMLIEEGRITRAGGGRRGDPYVYSRSDSRSNSSSENAINTCSDSPLSLLERKQRENPRLESADISQENTGSETRTGIGWPREDPELLSLAVNGQPVEDDAS